jgi:epidermal growth factor receptor substrate 15
MQYNKIAGGFATFPAPVIQGLSNAQQQQHPPSTPAGGTTPAPAAASFPPPQAPQFGAAPRDAYQQPIPPSQQPAMGGGFGNFGASASASTPLQQQPRVSVSGEGGFPSEPAPAPAGALATDDTWPAATPEDMARYQQMFQQHDKNGDGKLAGGEIAPLLLSLNPPKELLKDIWALADADRDGTLNREEFFVAVYLTERAREGRKPPASLPAGPFPPMAQQQSRSMEAPAQLSADLFGGGEARVSGGAGEGPSAMTSGQMGQGGQMDQRGQFGQTGGQMGQMGGQMGQMVGQMAQMGGQIGQMGGQMGQMGGPPSIGAPAGFGMTAAPTPAPAPAPAPPSMGGAHSRKPSEVEYAFRGPEIGFDPATVGPTPEMRRLQSARDDAAAADKELWEKERVSAQAKAASANLTQKLQDLVLFQRRCEASLADAADRAARAEREVEDLRGRVNAANVAVEQATSTLEASTSRAANAEQERNQLTMRLEELRAEQMSLASGGGGAAHDSTQAELQSLRAQVAEAESALGPHRQQAQAAAQQRMQLEMKLSELRMSAASADADAGSQRSQIARLERDVAAAVAGLAGGGEEAERVALPGVLQRVAAAHDDALRRAALLGVKPPPPPPTLAAALGVGVGAVELPTWSDWKELEEEGFDTVRLTWGGWAEGDKPDAPQPAPPTPPPIQAAPQAAIQTSAVPEANPSPSASQFPGGAAPFGGAFGGAGGTGASVASSSIAYGGGATGASTYGAGATGASAHGAGITGGTSAAGDFSDPFAAVGGAGFTGGSGVAAGGGALPGNLFGGAESPPPAPPPREQPAPAGSPWAQF